MDLNPIVYTEKVVRSFLRYQLTDYPFADYAARLAAARGEKRSDEGEFTVIAEFLEVVV